MSQANEILLQMKYARIINGLAERLHIDKNHSKRICAIGVRGIAANGSSRCGHTAAFFIEIRNIKSCFHSCLLLF